MTSFLLTAFNASYWAERMDETLITTLTREDILGDLFYAGGLGYFAQYSRNLFILFFFFVHISGSLGSFASICSGDLEKKQLAIEFVFQLGRVIN